MNVIEIIKLLLPFFPNALNNDNGAIKSMRDDLSIFKKELENSVNASSFRPRSEDHKNIKRIKDILMRLRLNNAGLLIKNKEFKRLLEESITKIEDYENNPGEPYNIPSHFLVDFGSIWGVRDRKYSANKVNELEEDFFSKGWFGRFIYSIKNSLVITSKSWSIILFIFWFHLILGLSSGQQPTLEGQKIDNYLQGCKNFSGAVLITQNDKIILKKGYGCANYEFDVANTPQTKFRIASNTKPFTAIAIMQLQEKGLLSVHDLLSKYIPGFAQGDKITIHHLLTHTSGIQNYYKKWAEVSTSKSLEEMVVVSAIKSWSLDFEPGTQYSYSNTGYSLLAYIIQKVSGMPYEQFLQENIFKPLSMADSGSDANQLTIKNKASGYIVNNGVITTAPSINNPVTLLGNGDLLSSLDDLYKWDQALYDEKILTNKSKESMFVPHVFMKSSLGRAHGYGWFIDTIHGKRVVEYTGALVGYLSKVMRFVDDGITIIILTNVEDQEQFGIVCDKMPVTLFGELNKFKIVQTET